MRAKEESRGSLSGSAKLDLRTSKKRAVLGPYLRLGQQYLYQDKHESHRRIDRDISEHVILEKKQKYNLIRKTQIGIGRVTDCRVGAG